MPSRSRDRRRTLTARVAAIAALAAVGGGSLAAGTALVIADAAITSAEARRLGDESAEVLARVTTLEGGALARAIQEEQRDLSPAGLRLAVHRDAVFVGGDASLPRGATGCATKRGLYDLHFCVARRGPWSVVVAANEAPGLGLASKLAVVLAAVVVAGAIGALASRALAVWAVGPLVRLRARLGDAPMDEAVDLGVDEGVPEIDALRGTLRSLLDRRAEALRAARLFAAGAAHELRTPLTTLSGELELLGEEPLPDPTTDRITALRATTARLAALVDRLLVFARLGAAEAMRRDAVDLGDLLDDLARRLPKREAHRLTSDLRTPGTVRGDESLLGMLCENLVHNALMHTGDAAVTVVLHERGDDIILDVLDEGPGVPARDRARLFEPFQRGVGADRGVGLGLALVAQIARAHGGEARFVDADRGAHVEVRLLRWKPRDA
ncbi:sensor histidine kinase [Minicystis rosea]|nr:sensor histidine kinase [Minicystis rosea]